jgi:hypothetical protein
MIKINVMFWPVAWMRDSYGQELVFPMANKRLARQFVSDFVDVTYILAARPGTRPIRDPFKIGEVKL